MGDCSSALTVPRWLSGLRDSATGTRVGRWEPNWLSALRRRLVVPVDVPARAWAGSPHCSAGEAQEEAKVVPEYDVAVSSSAEAEGLGLGYVVAVALRGLAAEEDAGGPAGCWDWVAGRGGRGTRVAAGARPPPPARRLAGRWPA
eukprot:gene10874-biopygen7873